MKQWTKLPADIDAVEDAERSALVERICASLAHALAGRLMVIAGRIELMAAREAQAGSEQTLRDLLIEMRRATELLDRARRFGEHLRPPMAPTNVADALAQVLNDFRPLADARRIEIAADPFTSLPMPHLPNGAFVVVLRALLGFVVARCACGTAARIGVRVSSVDRGRDRVECIVVRLRLPPGTHIPGDMGAIIDPWLTEPEGDAKARLLLALGVGSVRDYGGWADIGCDEGQSVLTVYWPVAATDVSVDASSVTRGAAAT